MKKNSEMKTRDLAYIGLGITALITGGIVIYQISSVIAIPGVKYILMAPYLSMIMYILMSKINVPHSILVIGSVFGLLMMAMNIFMTIAIISTSVLAELSVIMIHKAKTKAYIGSILFSGYTGVSALTISKYFIGGVFEEISINWIILTGFICVIFGYFGTKLGRKILKYVNLYDYSKS